MKTIVLITTALFLVGCGGDDAGAENSKEQEVFVENFDAKLSKFGQLLANKRYAALFKTKGCMVRMLLRLPIRALSKAATEFMPLLICLRPRDNTK